MNLVDSWTRRITDVTLSGVSITAGHAFIVRQLRVSFDLFMDSFKFLIVDSKRSASGSETSSPVAIVNASIVQADVIFFVA
jgi:hypothetical protein